MFKRDNTDPTATIFKDFFTILSCMLLLCLILVIAYVRPITEENATIDSPGDLHIEITWESDSRADVDLWVKMADDAPVFFRNKSGDHFNLLRDDLGTTSDFTDINAEIAFSRGLAEGKVIANVHWYGNIGSEPSVEVKYAVHLTKNNKRETVTFGKVKLAKVGQEITMVSFDLDSEGNVITGSKNTSEQIYLKTPKPKTHAISN